MPAPSRWGDGARTHINVYQGHGRGDELVRIFDAPGRLMVGLVWAH
eukprot:COSAG01_NODE_14471_length_1450_cov_1.103627_2_plen_46_part_00